MTRAFLSVAGEDIARARLLADSLSSQLRYLYTDTGKDAADMWEEERQALRESTVVVIYWSKNYLRKKGTAREIAYIAELLNTRKVGHPVIVRLDDTDLTATIDLPGDELHGRALLTPLTNRWRALATPFDADLVQRVVSELLIDNGTLAAPEFDRSSTIREISQLSAISLRQVKPVVWINGHEGYGRRYIADKFMRSFDPNSRRIEITFSDADGPLQPLLRLRSRAFRATESELLALVKASPDTYGGAREVSLLTQDITTLANSGVHVVFKLDAFHPDAARWIPRWLIDWCSTLTPTTRPLLFIIAQFGLSPALLRGTPLGAALSPYQVASLSFEEAKGYSARLTALYDDNPSRWSEEDIERLADAAFGNIYLLIGMARDRSRAKDLRLEPIEAPFEEHAFTQRLNNYLNLCVDNIRSLPDAMEIVLTLLDLTLVQYDDLKILFPRANLPVILSKLLELGLLETPTDGLYRVPALLARRLYSRLNPALFESTEGISRQQRLLRLLNSSPSSDLASDSVFLRIEARIRSTLLAAEDPKTGPYAAFMSPSYLLHAAIRSYDRQSYSQALTSLRLCARNPSEFREANTRCVMLRYFGLAAARENKTEDMLRAVQLLEEQGRNNPGRQELRVNPRADAEFVLGFNDRLAERWSEALVHYRNSLNRLIEDNDRRVSDCHREIAECFLKLNPIDYVDARFHAERAYASRENLLSLDILVKVLIESCWNDDSLNRRDRAALERRLEIMLARLRETSIALSNGSWHQRMAEDLAQSGEPQDLVEAIVHAKRASEISRREDFQPLVWRLLLRQQDAPGLAELVELTERAIASDRFNHRTKSVAARYLVAAHIALGSIQPARDVIARYSANFPRAVNDQLREALNNRNLENIQL